MTSTRQSLGRWGERVAEEYLRQRGYTILERNARTPHGELDYGKLIPPSLAGPGLDESGPRLDLRRDGATIHQSHRDIEQPHLYPWSTVLIVPTTDGRLFFKATAPETIYEAALTKKLGEWLPESMPELVAVDPARGWMLMRDGGEQLRQSIRPTEDIKPWVPVLRRYAEVQIALVDQVPEILALGIPDYRLAALPSRYSDLLADEESLMINRERD